MKKKVKKLFPLLGVSLFLAMSTQEGFSTSLGSIQMAVESSFFLETDKGRIEVKPVLPRNIYFYETTIFGVPVTVSKDDIVEVPVLELKRVVLHSREGTFYFLSPRTSLTLLERIKNPALFYVKDIDLSSVLKCKREGNGFSCTIEGADLANVVLTKPNQKQACIMFVAKNKEDIEREISRLYYERKFTLPSARQKVFNAIGAGNGVRVFCLGGTLADTILKKEQEKEKTSSQKEESSI